MQHTKSARFAVPALLAGAAGIGFAPIFVRLSEVGPSATAFYRVLFALPLLWVWTHIENRSAIAPKPEFQSDPLSSSNPNGTVGDNAVRAQSPLLLFGVSGFFFAADLAFWHWSIRYTTVANSTLLTNFAPFFVTLGARVLFQERITVALLSGMLLAVVGGGMLVGASVQLNIENVTGDLLALVTAIFYAAYLLSVKYLRRLFPTGKLMFGTGISSCIFLGAIAWLSSESFLILTWHGWLVLFGLALISHVGGQTLIAFSLAHLPASFSSVGLLLQPVVAALLAWGILAEPLTLLQMCGGGVILTGIAVAGARRR